jgi:hypothetical protein
MSLSQWRYLLVGELELTKARTLENWSEVNLDMRAGIVGGVRGVFMGDSKTNDILIYSFLVYLPITLKAMYKY